MKTKQTPEGTVLELGLSETQIGMVNRIKQIRVNGQLDALLSRPLAIDIVGSSGALMALVKMGHVRVVKGSDEAVHALYLKSDCLRYAKQVEFTAKSGLPPRLPAAEGRSEDQGAGRSVPGRIRLCRLRGVGSSRARLPDPRARIAAASSSTGGARYSDLKDTMSHQPKGHLLQHPKGHFLQWPSGHLLQRPKGLSSGGVTDFGQVRGNMENTVRAPLFPPVALPLSCGPSARHTHSGRSASSLPVSGLRAIRSPRGTPATVRGAAVLRDVLEETSTDPRMVGFAEGALTIRAGAAPSPTRCAAPRSAPGGSRPSSTCTTTTPSWRTPR
jgi:hypothetical protein